jgi:hypothetical protein
MHNHPFLTQGHSDQLTQQIRTTRPGMAHFAGSGPLNATCGQCVFLGYFEQVRDAAGNMVIAKTRMGCKKYFQLTQQHGPPVPPNTAACRHFERIEK